MTIDYMTVVTPLMLCLYSIMCFIVLNASRLPELFQKGKVWQIRVAYVLLSVILGYLLTEASLLLINLF